MDLRRELEDILQNHGHDVLLQRTSRKIRCACYNERYREADSNCPRCLGKGWLSRIERHRIRRQSASSVITLPNKKQQSSVGQYVVDSFAFFFLHDVHPKAGDIIMEVGWDKDKPTHLIQAFEITHDVDLREAKGRAEFTLVIAKEQTVATPIRHIQVQTIGKIKNYEIYYKKDV